MQKALQRLPSQSWKIKDIIREKIQLAELLEQENRPYDYLITEIDRLLFDLVPNHKESVRNSSGNSDDPRVNFLCKRAFIYYDWLSDYQKAIECYQELDRILQKSPTILKGLGDCLRKQGRHREAIEKYTEALDNDLDDESFDARVLNNKALSYIGLSLYNKEELDSAKQDLEKALEYEGDNVLYLCNLGRVLDRQNKTEEALKLYIKACDLLMDEKVNRKIDPANLRYLKSILSGLIEFKKVNYETEKDFKALNLPDDNETVRNLKEIMNEKNQAANELLNIEVFVEECREREIAQAQEQKAAVVDGKVKDMRIEELKKELEEHRKSSLEYKKIYQETKETQMDQSAKIDFLMKQFQRLEATKLDNWEKKIEFDSMIEDELQLKKLKEYYQAFTGTLIKVCTAANLVTEGKLQASTPSGKGNLAYTVVSSIPWMPSVISNAVKTVGEFWDAKEFKTDIRRLIQLGSGDTFNQKVGKAAYHIALDPIYQEKILIVTDKDLEPFEKNLLDKLVNYVKKKLDELDVTLYGALYRTAASKLGNRDANLLVIKWLKHEIPEDRIPEEFARHVVNQKDIFGLLPELERETEKEKKK